MSGLIELQRHDAVLVLSLNNPKTRNALSSEMIVELIERLLEAHADLACRALVLTGAAGHFCSGGDVSSMTSDRSVLAARTRIERAHRIIRLLTGGPKPVVAAVEGYAFGAGLSLAAACDVIVSSSAAKYSAVFAKVGLIPDMGALWTLPQRVGLVEARSLFFSARTIDADEALRLKLVDQLSSPGAALSEALIVAQQFALAPPLAMAVTKAALAKGCLTLEDALRAEVESQPMLYQSQDHQDAVIAFREKRTPVFNGR
jgi:2-(1,2-epoxy-1,2-dihydrophenyl)acetyl-CoA isomerase